MLISLLFSSRSRRLGDFDASIGIGQLQLAAAGADCPVQRISAQVSSRGHRQLGRNSAEGSARRDVITYAIRDVDADGGERRLQRNVAATAGGAHRGHGDRTVL